MSHFYARVYSGASKAVTKRGHRNNGLTAHISGWNGGVFVTIEHIDGKDCITVCKTGGSNDAQFHSDRVVFTEGE